MGKLKEGALKFVICFITGFLAGVLAGIAVLSVIVSYRTDNYYKQISYLEHIIRKSSLYCSFQDDIYTVRLGITRL
jgi:hypothetical protein